MLLIHQINQLVLFLFFFFNPRACYYIVAYYIYGPSLLCDSQLEMVLVCEIALKQSILCPQADTVPLSTDSFIKCFLLWQPVCVGICADVTALIAGLSSNPRW